MSTYVTLHSKMPDVALDIDFANNPTSASRTWTSMSDRLREIHVRVYRSSELDEFQVGSMVVVLNNRDRALEPTFAASTYSPNVVPRRPIRYRARWSGVEYERFWGFTRRHGIQWPGLSDGVTVIEAADIGMLLNRDQVLLNGYPEETADVRINRVLDDIGVPAGVRSIDTSDATIAAVAAVDVAAGVQEQVVGALAHCQDCARSDGGYFFIARDGDVIFHNRRHRKDVLGSPTITFGDVAPPAAGEVPYGPDMVGQADDERLWNRAAVITADGVREEYTNTTSTARYWASRRDDYQSLLSKPGDAAARASLYVWRYSQAEPTIRFPHLTVPMINRTGMDMPAMLAADVGTRIRVKRRPPGGGTMIDEEAHVEGITEDVDAATPMFALGLDVSPADPTLDEWILQTDTLGSTAIVGF